jgi:hypothetical protein
MNTNTTTVRKTTRASLVAVSAARARTALRPSLSVPQFRRHAGAFWDTDQPFYVNLLRPAARVTSFARPFSPLPPQSLPP